jgi:hypothetical protein
MLKKNVNSLNFIDFLAAAIQLTQILVNIQNNGILPAIGKRDLVKLSDKDLNSLVDHLLDLINSTIDLINQGLLLKTNMWK